MEWKRRLDEEEATVERMEKEVLVRMETGGKVDTMAGGKGFVILAPRRNSKTIALINFIFFTQ